MARKPLIRHAQIIRFGRILNMLYHVNELAQEIGVTPDTITRSYIPAGLPHTRTANNRIWIHGPTFVAWARSIRQRNKISMPENHAWCTKCDRPVEMINAVVVYTKSTIEVHQSICQTCGCKVNRIKSTKERGQ